MHTQAHKVPVKATRFFQVGPKPLFEILLPWDKNMGHSTYLYQHQTVFPMSWDLRFYPHKLGEELQPIPSLSAGFVHAVDKLDKCASQSRSRGELCARRRSKKFKQ